MGQCRWLQGLRAGGLSDVAGVGVAGCGRWGDVLSAVAGRVAVRAGRGVTPTWSWLMLSRRQRGRLAAVGTGAGSRPGRFSSPGNPRISRQI